MIPQVVYFSGVQCTTKTTTIRNVATELNKAGFSMYVFPEMGYIPNYERGSVHMQSWYKKELFLREQLINYMIHHKIVDIVLADRSPMDVEVYNTYFGLKDGREISDYWEPDMINKHNVIMLRPVEEIVNSIVERYADETHRENWNEHETEYVDTIQQIFHNIGAEREYGMFSVLYDETRMVDLILNFMIRKEII